MPELPTGTAPAPLRLRYREIWLFGILPIICFYLSRFR